jgi:hypothetical protein
MKKRRIIAVLIAFILTIAATAMWSASTIVREGDPDAIVLEDDGSEAGTIDEQQPKKKGGNKVVKVLAAPFKAFGRLFGGGDKENKIERMTEKTPSVLRALPSRASRMPERSSPSQLPVPRASISKLDASS